MCVHGFLCVCIFMFENKHRHVFLSSASVSFVLTSVRLAVRTHDQCE